MKYFSAAENPDEEDADLFVRNCGPGRHTELIAGQHDFVRRALLGDEAAKERLRAIEVEITQLQAHNSLLASNL